MYEAHSFRERTTATAMPRTTSIAAIGHAEDLGLPEEAEALRKRLEHVKAVFRSQFVQ